MFYDHLHYNLYSETVWTTHSEAHHFRKQKNCILNNCIISKYHTFEAHDSMLLPKLLNPK